MTTTTITKYGYFPEFSELYAAKYDDLLEVNYGAKYESELESLWGFFSLVEGNYYTMYFGMSSLVIDGRDIISGQIEYVGVWSNIGPFEDTEEWDNGQLPLLEVENAATNIKDGFNSFDGEIDFEALVSAAKGSGFTFEGSQLDDGVYGSPGEDILNGNAGDDELEGNAGSDVIDGGVGDDLLKGGDGDDRIEGGLGDDTLTGGSGSDTFIFKPDFGSDIVTDFDTDVDALKFYDADDNLLSVSVLTETQNADGDVVLSVSDGSSVTLEGVSQYLLPSETVGAISATNSGSGSNMSLNFYVDPSLVADAVTSFDMVVSFDSDGAEYVSTDLGDFLGFPNVSGDTITLSGISLSGISTSDPLFTLNFTDLDTSANLVINITDVLVNNAALESSTLAIGGPEALDVSVSVASRSGTALSDVVMSFDEGSDITTATSSLAGVGTAAITSGSEVTVTGALDYDAASKSITSQDALDALRLSVGMDTQNGSRSAFDYIAADFNQDGRVTSSDALDILKNAVGLPTDEQPEWVFVDSNGDYSDVSRLDTSYEDGLTISGLSEATTVSLTGILVGDVNDSYSALVEEELGKLTALTLSLSRDAATFIEGGLDAERDVQIVSDKISGFYDGINGANAVLSKLDTETVTDQDAITVSNEGIFITTDGGYTLALEFTNFSPSSLNQLQTMFEGANDINDINLSGGFKKVQITDPDGSTLLQLSHSSSGITWENPNADAGMVDTFMLKGTFANQIKDYIDFIKDVDAVANELPLQSTFLNLIDELNSSIALDGVSITSDGQTVFDFSAKENGTLTLTLMGTDGDHVLEFGLGLDGIEKIGNDLFDLSGGEDAFFNMLFEDQLPNDIQQYFSDTSSLDEIELALGYDFAGKDLIDIRVTDFSRIEELEVDPFILEDLLVKDTSANGVQITTLSNPTYEVQVNLLGFDTDEVTQTIDDVAAYHSNDFGLLLDVLFVPDTDFGQVIPIVTSDII